MQVTFSSDRDHNRELLYASATETVVLPDSAGANVVSVATSEVGFDIGNQKIRMSAEVSEVSAGDGGVEIEVQASVDGVSWLTMASTALAIDTTALATSYATFDLTSMYAYKWRLRAISDGTDILDSCTFILTIAGIHAV